MTKSSVFEREDDIVELGRGKCIENEGGRHFYISLLTLYSNNINIF